MTNQNFCAKILAPVGSRGLTLMFVSADTHYTSPEKVLGSKGGVCYSHSSL